MDEDELLHYGVQGMKWGHKKGPTTSELKDKARKVADNPMANKSDRNLARLYSRSDSVKYGSVVSAMVVGQAVTNSYGRKKWGPEVIPPLSKKQHIKTAVTAAASSVPYFKYQDAVAKSALKNYDNNGNLINPDRAKKRNTKESLASTYGGMAIIYTSKYASKKINNSTKYTAKGKDFVNSIM